MTHNHTTPGSLTAKDALHTALNVTFGGAWVFRHACHVILTGLLVDGSLTERVTAANYGATLQIGVEAGLDTVDRYVVRFATASLLTLMAVFLLRANAVTHELGAVFLAAQLAIVATDPLHEVILDVIQS